MSNPDSPSATDPSHGKASHATNTVNIGDHANVEQIAVGENITQIKGYTADQVNVLLTRIQTEYRPKPFDGRSPYVGLDAFQERDADRFFGRETLIADLVARVTSSAASNARAVFVAGPSGSGKSSLVRAGLIPALRKGSESEHWLYETMKPGREPLAELERVLSRFWDSPNRAAEFQAHVLDDATQLHAWVNIALGDETNRRAFIVIDQFEEIFTQLSPDQEKTRAAFLQQLTQAATVENGRTLVVFTLRSDFVTNCASYQALNALVNQQFLQVGAMSPDELVSAIARPALQVGLRLDPALIAQIVNDVRGEPGALPLMQFALKDLFDAQKEQGELTLDGYVARGGLHEALERHADAEFAKLQEDEKQLARNVFSGLIEIGRGHEDTKRTANFDDLVPAGADATKVQALVRELADARLITTDQQGDKETVTLAHERLIDAWGWLRKLVDEDREAIALKNQIGQDAQEWVASGRNTDYLYKGARLATAQEQVANKKIALSELAQAFVDASIDARERERADKEAARQRELEQARVLAEEQQKRAEEQQAANARLRRRNLFLAGAFVVAVIAVIAALIFLTQSQANLQTANEQRDAANQAKETAVAESIISQSKSLAVQSNALRSKDLETSWLLGVEAMKMNDNYETRNNLLVSLETTHLIRTLRGPSYLVALSADGMVLASASEGKTIQLWDISDLTLPKPLGEPLTSDMDSMSSLALSSDGRFLALGGDSTIRLWDVSDVTRPKHMGDLFTANAELVNSVAFSPTNNILVSGGCEGDAQNICAQGVIRLWDVTDAANPKLLEKLLTSQGDSVFSVAVNSDGSTLAAGSADGKIRLWDVSDVTDIKPLGEPLTGHMSPVQSVVFSSDGKMLASGSGDVSGGANDNTVRLWDVSDVSHPQLLGKPLSGHTKPVYSVAFSPDGKTLASGSEDTTIRLWGVSNVEDVKPLGEPLSGHTYWVTSIAFNPDGKTLISGSFDNTIRIWNVHNVTYPKHLDKPLLGHTDVVRSVAFGPDNRTLASGGDGTIRLWDVTDVNHPKSLGEPLTGHSHYVSSVAFSPDGKTLASGSSDNTIRLWNVSNVGDVKPLGEPLSGHTSWVTSIAYSPDGKTLASGSCESDAQGHCKSGQIRLWDLSDVSHPKPLGEPLIGHANSVRSVAFSPDGKTLASGSEYPDKTIWLWDVSDNTHPEPLGEPLIGLGRIFNSIAFSPDGKTLATGIDSAAIHLWDVSDVTHPKPLGEPLDSRNAKSIAFSPDGKRLASGNTSGMITLWDVSDMSHPKLLGEPFQHTYGVESVAFSPDGRMLASGGDDHTIQLWDMRMNFSDLQTHTCMLVQRNLTRAEYAQYISREAGAYDAVYAQNPTCPGLPVEPLPTPSPTP